MKKYDIVIVGGGASGLMCAMQLVNSNKNVAILEAGYSIGKKILVTGNGKCNLTNKNMDSDYYNRSIEAYLQKFNSIDTIKFFNSIGLETYADESGRVYPFTNSAKSVVDIINKQLSRSKNVDILCNYFVKNIIKSDKGFVVGDDNSEIMCDNLVIACGNIDNRFLKDLKLKCIERTPSLVALKTIESTKNLEGVRINNVKLTANVNGVNKSDMGEVLFKDGGISGVVVFNISTLFAREKNFIGEVVIDLLPHLNKNQTMEVIKSRCEKFDLVGDIFTGLFIDAVKSEIFNRCKVDEKLKTSKLTQLSMEKIAGMVHNFKFTIKGYFDNNQVVSGGVDIDECDFDMESKKTKGLFVIGEACDVDGECGGYNLQWAWTSGAIVGKRLNKL